ncbi:putative peptidase (DUF1758) domain-containing protein [Phthorimaea operculella]|nr:putative peptidase (DUF1758) domain-containing protein [Phthorimaea operculella]
MGQDESGGISAQCDTLLLAQEDAAGRIDRAWANVQKAPLDRRTNAYYVALTNIGVDVDSWDVIIIHILTLKLDPETRRQWEFYISDSADELPTYSQFKEFLTNRYRAMECLPADRYKIQKPTYPNHQHATTSAIRSFHATNDQCQFCKGAHKIGICKRFAQENVDSRRKFVLMNNICFCCLGSGHSAKACQRYVRCRVCHGKHHTVLHPLDSDDVKDGPSSRMAGKGNDGTATSGDKSAAGSSGQEPIKSLVSAERIPSEKVFKQVLLATALVNAQAKDGEPFTLRALLDQGSMSSFVTESTVQALGLHKIPCHRRISGVGGEGGLVSKAKVNLNITSRIDPNVVIPVAAFVLKSVTSLVPSSKIESIEWKELSNLVLADPEWHTPNRIDMLLGGEVYGQVIEQGLKKAPQGSGSLKQMLNSPKKKRYARRISIASSFMRKLLKGIQKEDT